MSGTWGDGSRIEIHAPDARTAFALEQRLVHFWPVAIGDRSGWVVELDDDDNRYDEIEVAIHHWLRDFSLTETVVTAGGRARIVDLPDAPRSEQLQIGLGMKP